MPDFSHLLSKPSGEIEKPKPMPSGTYFGIIARHEFGVTTKNQTPYVRFHVNNLEAGPDIDPELLALSKIDLTKKEQRIDFYLTEDALYRLNEFLLGLGIDNGGGTRSLEVMIPEANNMPVQLDIGQQQGQGNNADTVYNVVNDVAARQS